MKEKETEERGRVGVALFERKKEARGKFRLNIQVFGEKPKK